MASIVSSKDLGSLLREARRRAGLTLAECAGASGVGIRFLSELERGKESAELGLALRVAAALGIRLQATFESER